MLTLLVSIFSLINSHSAEILNCADLWENRFPLSGYRERFDCVRILDIPASYGSHSIYLPIALAPGGEPSVEAQKLVDLIEEAIGDTQNVYKSFTSVGPSSIIYTKLKNTDGNGAIVPFTHHQGEEPVPLLLFTNMFEDSEAEQKQTLAHELFHVVQAHRLQAAAEPKVAMWWVEGSADFFSNLVYPKTNREWPNIEAYDSDQAVFRQTSSYSTAAYFQSLANSWLGVNGVWNLISSAQKKGPFNDISQWKWLSNEPSQDLHWADFAKNFTLGKIVDTGGGMIPTHYVWPEPTAVTTDHYSTMVSPQSFGVQTWAYSLEPGYNYLLSLDADQVMASSKKRSDENWSEYYVPALIKTRCKEAPQILDILGTSVTAPDERAGRLEIKIDRQPGTCDCEKSGSVLGSLVGEWVMDMASYREFIEATVGQNSTVLGTSGQARLTIEADHSFRYEMIDLAIQARQEDGTRIEVVGNGMATQAQIQTGSSQPIGPVSFCLRDTQTRAQFKTTITLPGMPPIEGESPIEAIWEEEMGYSSRIIKSESGPVLEVDRVIWGSEKAVTIRFFKKTP